MIFCLPIVLILIYEELTILILRMSNPLELRKLRLGKSSVFGVI